MLSVVKPFLYLLPVALAGYAAFWACLTPSARREVGFLPLAVFLVLAAAGFLSPNLWVMNAVFFLVPPLLARSREQTGLILLVGMLASPSFNVWLMVGGLQLISQSVQMTLALGALVTLLMHRKRSVRRPFSADLPMAMLTLLIFVLNVRGTSATNVLRESLTTLVALIVPYLVFTRAMESPASLRRALLWLTAAVSILSAIGVYEALSHWPLYANLEDRFDVRSTVTTVKFRAGWMRAYGPFLEATLLGMILVFGFAAAFVSRAAFAGRTKYFAMLGLIGIGTLTPQSRGAWLGVAVVIFGVSVYRARGRPFGMVIAGAVAGVILLAVNWTSGSADTAGTVDYRSQLAQRGLEEFWKRPWTGDTLPNVLGRLADLRQGEGIIDFVNTYLYYALLGGVVGFLIFVACLLISPARLWRQRHRLPPQSPVRDTAAFCFAVLLASAAMLAFTAFFGQPRLMVLLVMGLAGTLPQLARQTRPEAARAPTLPPTAHAQPALPRQPAELSR